MKGKSVVLGLLAVMVLLVAVSFAADDKSMWCNLSNEEFDRLCQDQQFMQGLTPQQRMEIDREWQRRIPDMTPEEVQKYYPQGRRYNTAP